MVEEEVAYAEPLEEDRGPRWWLWGLLAALLIAGAIAAALLLAGEDKKPVPRVVGADVATAARTLRNEGFKPVRRARAQPAPEGRGHRAGRRTRATELEVGEEVTLTVSDGPGLKGVPDVDGLTKKQARDAPDATRASRCASASEASDDVAEGQGDRDGARRRARRSRSAAR